MLIISKRGAQRSDHEQQILKINDSVNKLKIVSFTDCWRTKQKKKINEKNLNGYLTNSLKKVRIFQVASVELNVPY